MSLGMALHLLHTNDFHGMLDGGAAHKIAELREQDDALYFDCGDAIKTGNLGIPLKPDPVWPLLAQAGCIASVPGNRESHVLKPVFEAKIAGSTHPILCANWQNKAGEQVLPPAMIVEHRGVRVGIFGVMVPMVTAKMATSAASAYLWTSPIPTAVALAEELRPNVDCLIALTHIGFSQDQKLAAAAPMIDLILGGHSHTVLSEPHLVGKVAICQTGSHARFVGRYTWENGAGLTAYELVGLRA
jgi:5'-nucleotidase